MKTKELELSGYIQKRESLTSLQTHIIDGTLVLQTSKPFNGYYASDPDEYIPQTVFLVTTDEFRQDEISRAATRISKYIDIDIDAARAEITIFNEVNTAIRLYDIKNYEDIKKIQEAFVCEGIRFKNASASFEGDYIVKIWKVFLLEEIEQGIYLNKSKSKMFYFSIPYDITFSHFGNLDTKIRNNWEGKSYDAALGLFYRKHGIENIIRIFSNHISKDMIEHLPKRFHKFIET